MKRLERNDDRPAFPLSVGDEVGYIGQRVTITFINERYPHRIQVRLPSGLTDFAFISELTDAPQEGESE